MDMHFCTTASFGPVFNFGHGQNAAMRYPEDQYPVYAGFPGLQYMYASQQPPNDFNPERNSVGDGKTESKPRLSKEEVDRLEKIFQENPKPSSSVKAQLADELGLERPRINNWFQNRRAKAKQERKQEEYEARRAAEKGGSEPNSPIDAPSSTPESFERDASQRMKPSSAPFPDMKPLSKPKDLTIDSELKYEEDSAAESDDFDSPTAHQPSETNTDDHSTDLQSPQPLNFAQSDGMAFSYPQASQGFTTSDSLHGYDSFDMEGRQSSEPGPLQHGLPSPESQLGGISYQTDQYLKLIGTNYSNSTAPFFATGAIADERGIKSDAEDDFLVEDSESSSSYHAEQMTPPLPQGVSTPTTVNSFKSPPPPANIATRRNIPRPAALQVNSIRSRSYNIGCGPKTGMDGFRRGDPTSPATAMRRIVSAGGNMAGRIHKQTAGPRSPMFLSRNTEAYLQYHSRSPVGVLSAAFSSASPPTPMTPAVLNHFGREPAVSSTCSDDEAFMLGQGFSAIESIKTPPETPGLNNVNARNLSGNSYSTGMDFATDQPLLTPYFQTELPDLALRNVPSYLDMSDSSLPTTPLFTNLMGTATQESSSLAASALGNAQFDWEANESINSTKSSPGQPRSRQIQFTQNITPQDYSTV